MAVKVIGWVWEHSRSEGAARLTLLAIADCTNASGNDAWPSVTELCKKTRLSERGLQKAIRRLEEIGELEVTKNVGRGRTNRYQVIMETPNVVRGSGDQETRTADGVSDEPNPEQSAGITKPRTECGDTAENPNVVPETPNHVRPEPSRTVSTTNPYGVGAHAPTREEPTAQTLVGEWIDHCRSRPPQRVIGQVAKEINSMLREGIAYADVRAGLAAWHQKGLHPSTLASVVHEVMNTPSSAAVAKPSTTDQRIAAGQALKQQLRLRPVTIRGELE